LQKVLGQETATCIHGYGTLHGILQLAHITRPRAPLYPFDRLLGQPHRFILALAEALNKVRQ
jgi:hypothetical protein